MKKFVLIIFLVGFCNVFATFEFDILGNLTSSTSFPMTESKANKVNGSTEAIFGATLQLGNQFSMNNALKGISVFAEVLVEQETIALTLPGDTKTVSKKTGLNLGAGLNTKFIFGSVNSLVPRDTILGFGLGAKILVNAPNVILSTSIPIITPYVDVFVEQRFFVSRKLALICGLHIGMDMMIFQATDMGSLFNGIYVTAYPSMNIGLSIGFHFGH